MIKSRQLCKGGPALGAPERDGWKATKVCARRRECWSSAEWGRYMIGQAPEVQRRKSRVSRVRPNMGTGGALRSSQHVRGQVSSPLSSRLQLAHSLLVHRVSKRAAIQLHGKC